MPLMQISTSSEIVEKENLLKKSSIFLSDLLGKSENYVMVKLNDRSQIYFSGNDEPCSLVEIRSIGSLNPSKMAKPICQFISLETNIPIDRIYINFVDIAPSMWAWNERTFG
tara:strand:- start:1707 stop:2042 length:336 start_codon:yes stop_codon:yes gene_type:complete